MSTSLIRLSSLCLSLTLAASALPLASFAGAAPTQAMELAAKAASSEALSAIAQALGSEKSATQVRVLMQKLGVDDNSIEKAMKDPVYAQQAMVARLKLQQASPALQKDAASILGLGGQFSAAKGVTKSSAGKSEVSDALAASSGSPKLKLGQETTPATGDKAHAFLTKIDELTAQGHIRPLLDSSLKLAVTQYPSRVASIVGDGFFSSCGDLAKSEIAGTNYIQTILDGSRELKPADEAIAIKNSLMRTTGATEKVAKADICKLAGPPCYLYNPSGPAALNCE